MISGHIPNSAIIIEAVTDPGAARACLAPICHEWTATGSFWNLESCLETMGAHHVLSASAVNHGSSSKGWVGWYLATCQGTDCELLFIYTASANRGQGIANKLLNDLIKRAGATDGIESLFLEVRVSNTSAIRLYEKSGFVRQSIRPRYYSNGEDALVYRLTLKK
jgi:ribosomal protein S18 acetylase RimI-like enzyme